MKTEYHGVDGDFVYSGIGGWFIGNNPNAKPASNKLNFSERHSIGNYNINNLKYVYDSSDEKELRNKIKIENTLKNIHSSSNGERIFNHYKEVK